MQILELVNKNISFYRNNDYKWVRELTTSFEEYFDNKFREFLSSEYSANMQEVKLRQLFLSTLRNLYDIIEAGNYFEQDGESFDSAFSRYLVYSNHPASNKESIIDKGKMKKLFDQVTMPWLIFEMNFYKHSQRYNKLMLNYSKSRIDTRKLDQDKQSLEIAIAKLEGIIETKEIDSDKLDEDKQAEIIKSIKHMTKSYIETCNSFQTSTPTNSELSKISGVEKGFWVHQRINDLFLKSLTNDLMHNYRQAKTKEKKDFWWDAVEFVDKRFEFTKDGYDFKKAGISENIDYKNTVAQSVGKKRAHSQTMLKKTAKTHHPKKEIKNCDKCGKEISEGYRCEDCIIAFREKSDASYQPEESKCDRCFEVIEEGSRCEDCISEYGEC